MQRVNTFDRKALLDEVSQRVTSSGDAIQLLLQFVNSTAQLRDVLYRLTEHDGYESTSAILEDIEENLVEAERFIREESFACLANANREFEFESPLPDDIRISCDGSGMQFSFPLWMFGHRKPKDVAPSFHKKRPYVREQVFWNAIIQRMIAEQPGITLRRRIPEQACLKIEFATRLKNARDLDHYCLSPFVNSLVYNGLVFSDHPARLKYCISWREVENGPESVNVSIDYHTSTL